MYISYNLKVALIGSTQATRMILEVVWKLIIKENVKNTSKHIPWKIKTAISFTDKQKALEFETYLKTASGRAFAKKRL